MAKKKYYAVLKGKKTGIFETWDECKASVDGYSGAVYKSFLTQREAEEFLGLVSKEETQAGDGQTLIAYVDGSFDLSLGRYSFGCVFLTPDGEKKEVFGNGNQPESLAIRNVAGEMLGAMYAVRWAEKHGYSSVEIRYDYEGIEKWATGMWRAKMELTQKYALYMRKKASYMQIRYQKVAAHTGDFYNELADQLAKRGLTEGNGIPDIES